MLDDSSAAQEVIDSLKGKLNELMHYDGDDLLEFFINKFGEKPPNVVCDSLIEIKNPYKAMQEIKSLIDSVILQIEQKLKGMGVENELLESYRQTEKVFDIIFH